MAEIYTDLSLAVRRRSARRGGGVRNYLRSFRKTQRAVGQAVEMHAPRCTWNLSSAFCMLPRDISGLAVLAIDTFSTLAGDQRPFELVVPDAALCFSAVF